ncbi:MAG: phosphoglucomutase/phosphomannomutase family protein [Balneolia bacterium]|nr:phosphoglucomutase/phosphomannomutase family protein [Balneolia bacterium]
MSDIKFGTDGWRAIIAEQYTFDNVARVAAATAAWIKDSGVTSNGVVMGYDARFLSREFAVLAARVITSEGVQVRLSNDITPTPAVSLGAQQFNAVGVVITASHNPPEYNGYKIKAPFGGSASPAQIREVEARIPDTFSYSTLESLDDLMEQKSIVPIDLNQRYLDIIRERIDLDLIAKHGAKIAHDSMFGSGSGMISALLGDQVINLHDDRNPGFHGTNPEPIVKNLIELPEVIRENSCFLGIANDGDADRVGMFDENGNYVDSHQILSLLAKYMADTRGLKGELVKTISTTDMMRKQAEKYGLTIHTTPIGFKYITEKILEGDVLVCGEESGGIAVKGHLAERDGIYIGLLIAEMCARRGKSLSALVQELFDEFGEHHCRRNDLHTTEKRKLAMIDFCKGEKLTSIGGSKVVKTEQPDGIKHWLEDGGWLLVRASGTEPVLRIYSEASTPERAQQLVNEVSEMVESDVIFS